MRAVRFMRLQGCSHRIRKIGQLQENFSVVRENLEESSTRRARDSRARALRQEFQWDSYRAMLTHAARNAITKLTLFVLYTVTLHHFDRHSLS